MLSSEMNPNSVSVLMTTAHICGDSQASGLIHHLLFNDIQPLHKVLEYEKQFVGTHDHN